MKNTLHIFFFFALFSWCNLDAQTNNIDFELTPAGTYTTANAVSGWTVSSRTATSCNSSTVWTAGSPEFSVLSTPQLSFPFIGTIPHSFLGGTKIACLNNTTANSTVTKLTHTISVTSSSTLFQLAFAGVWQEGIHACCEQAGFEAMLFDNLGSVIPCNVPILSGASCQSIIGFSTTSSTKWTNWQVKYVDLTPYIGTTVTLEISSHDCVFGDHYGTLLIDAKLGGFLVGSGLTTYYDPGNNNSVNFCSGSNQASIFGIPGYQSYQWYAPGTGSIAAPQGTMANLTISNPIAGSVYTLNMTIANGSCVFTNTYALSYSSVSITATGTSSTCIGGASGSASVLSSGSGTGYTYTWLNSNNALIGNSSTISNLSPGVYSIMVTAAGAQSTSCGSAMRTVTIHTSPQSLINVLKPYCGNEAYLTTLGGSNHQWYNNLTAISSTMGGTASSYTVVTPTNGGIYYLRYFSNQGCQDSIKYTLTSISSGTLNISSTTICPGANNGAALINILPTSSAPYGMNYFFVNSVGTTPQYYASINPTSFNSYSISNLFSGGTYSVNAFDGLCKYSTSFTVPALSFDYSLTPSNSPTLCSGNGLAANINFSSTPTVGQYTYSWSPSALLFGATSQNAILNPTTSPGNQITLTYSVIVTPTLANCPLTKTLSITVINPVTPTISSIPVLCSGSWSAYSISVNPPGGTFSGGGIGFTSVGTIMPAFSSIGTFSFVYTAPPQGNCISTTAGTYTVDYSPVINPLGNQLSICEGQSANLSVTCYGSYTWSTGMTNGPITVTPSTTTSYSVFTLNAAHTCSTEAVLTLTVVPIPTISISGNSICLGSSGTLTASGATSYSWSNGSTSSVIIVPPINGTPYTVLGANSQTCVNTSSTVLNIIPTPTITISGNSSVCDGQPVTLLGSGANTYHWNNTTLGAVLSLTPTSTSVFTLTGTDILTNCSAQKTITVNVLPNPTLSIVGDTTFCLGETKSFSVLGANIYSWSNGSNSSSISITPTHNTTYTLLGTNTLGSCSSSKTISILVSPCTGIEKNMLSDDVSIYPNPSNGNYFIEAENISTILVTDELGKIIVEEHFKKENYQLDLSDSPNGVYTLKLFYNQHIKTIKLIKVE